MSHDIPLSVETQAIIQHSCECAQRLNHRVVCTEHLLLGLLECNDATVTIILQTLRVPPKELREAIEFVIGKGNKSHPLELIYSESVDVVIRFAQQEARHMHNTEVNPEHLLLGLMREPHGIASGVMESFDITADPARREIIRLQGQGHQHTVYALEHQAQYKLTPTLNMVSRDLTSAALNGLLDPLIGREQELERTMQVLSRRSKNNPVLIGSAGVGKTAIAEGLAQRIITGQVPDLLRKQRVVALDVGLLTIGTKYRGEFEERLKKILAEIVAARNLIIVVDELHTLIGAGVAEGSVDAANLLKPILARGDFRCLGTTTLDDYRKTIERDPALERRFQTILVPEATTEETLLMLQGLKDRYEKFHHVKITTAALQAATTLSSRYIQDRQLPDKAIDLMDEAAARLCVGRSIVPASLRILQEKLEILRADKNAAIETEDFPLASALWKQERNLCKEMAQVENEWQLLHESADVPTVDEHCIAGVVSAWTGIPAIELTMQESQRLLHLEEELHARVMGQQQAVSAVARAIRRSRTNVRDAHRPIGSFVFAGPTGVGKTELARSLAITLFGSEDALITFDMSEFSEPHFAARLVGSPPGYAGYEQAGQLTESVRRKPYAVVLFDEIEKAHGRIFEMLLQILEDGQLSDAKGRTVDFRNTIIILTSNVGALQISGKGSMNFRQGGSDYTQIDRLQTQVLGAIKQLFRPELINRFDDMIVFQPLTAVEMRQIADRFLSRVANQLLERQIQITYTGEARDYLAVRGHDTEYGARPLRRLVQTAIEDPLAEMILCNTLTPGDRLSVGYSDSMLTFTKTVPATVLSPVSVSAAEE